LIVAIKILIYLLDFSVAKIATKYQQIPTIIFFGAKFEGVPNVVKNAYSPG
jgi:hypothetical protein